MKKFLLILGLCLTMLCVTFSIAMADGDPAYTYDADTHTLTLTGGDFSKDSKWGSDLTTSEVYHVTAQPGVRFVGDCRNMFSYFSYCTDIDLHNVNTSQMTFGWQLFSGATGLTSLNVTGWDLSSLTDMNGLFNACRRLQTLDLSNWDVSGVTNMRMLFYNCSALTSVNTSGWDVSHVTSMENAFGNCTSLVTLDLSAWDVSGATRLNSMFAYCSRLTSLNISTWDVSGVQSMNSMFQNCTRLSTLDLSNWDVSSVTDFTGLFQNCSSLTSVNVAGWNTAKSYGFSYAFSGCTSLTSLDLTGWTIYDIYPTYCSSLFDKAAGLRSITLSPPKAGTEQNLDYQSYWRLNNGENGEGWIAEGTTTVISGADEFALIPAPEETTTYIWNPLEPRFSYDSTTKALTLNYGDYDKNDNWTTITKASVKSITANAGVRFVGDCSGLFYNFSGCESMDLSQVDTSGMTSAEGLFAKCGSLTELNPSSWETSAVTDMSFMFQDCSGLTSLNLTAWDTSAVTNMEYLFDGCLSLSTLNVAGWDTSAVTNMEALFRNCYEITALDLMDWDTSSVTNMSHMFYSVSNELTTLDLSSWNVSSVTQMDYMFKECYVLETLTIPTSNITAVTDMEGMFKDCFALTALDLSGLTVSESTVADDLFSGASSLARITLPAGVGIGGFMCLNNGDSQYPTPGWITQGDAAGTLVSGTGDYAVISPAEQATTYIWRFNAADHPNAVVAFDDEGHWIYCPDCGRGLEGTYDEHGFNRWEDIDRVQITVPNSQAQSITDLPANTPMGVGNTVQFINDSDEMSFTYLPDDSGRISCRDDESESLYLPGGFATTPENPYPAFANTYMVYIPGASMDMWVEYDSCDYGFLEIGIAHADKGKIWADKWFVKEGETVTFGVSSIPGYGCRIVVKCGGTEIQYSQGTYEGEYTFTMPRGNVVIEPTFEELPSLHLPGNTETVEESAFEGSGAKVVYVNDGCNSIGPGAFKNCTGLQVVHIPASVTEIDDTAFDGCGMDLWIYGEAGSYAETFCKTHNPHFHEESTEW